MVSVDPHNLGSHNIDDEVFLWILFMKYQKKHTFLVFTNTYDIRCVVVGEI